MRPINSLKKFFKLLEWSFVDSIDKEIEIKRRGEVLLPDHKKEWS